MTFLEFAYAQINAAIQQEDIPYHPWLRKFVCLKSSKPYRTNNPLPKQVISHQHAVVHVLQTVNSARARCQLDYQTPTARSSAPRLPTEASPAIFTHTRETPAAHFPPRYRWAVLHNSRAQLQHWLYPRRQPVLKLTPVPPEIDFYIYKNEIKARLRGEVSHLTPYASITGFDALIAESLPEFPCPPLPLL